MEHIIIIDDYPKISDNEVMKIKWDEVIKNRLKSDVKAIFIHGRIYESVSKPLKK